MEAPSGEAAARGKDTCGFRSGGVRNTELVPSNLELAAKMAEILPTGDWVAATANEEELQRRLEVLRELASPDLEVAMIGPGGFTGNFHGIDGFRAAWDDWLGPFDTYSVEIEELREAGDRVVALARHTARPKGTEATVEGSVAAVMTFRAGNLVRIEFNLDRAAALRTAGLEQ
jgi:ketosteroid isomerase-like protein